MPTRARRRTIGANLLSNAAGALGTRVVTVLLIVIIARVSGAASLGVFVLATSLATTFNILLGDISVTTDAVRVVSADAGRAEQYLRVMPWLTVLPGLCTLITSIVVAKAFYPAGRVIIVSVELLALSVLIQSVTSGYRWYFRATQRFDLDAKINATIATGSLVLCVPLLLYFHDVRYVCLGIVLASVGALVRTLTGLRGLRTIPKPRLDFRDEALRPLVAGTLPYAGMALIGALMSNVDILLLGHWRATESVGVYGAAVRILQALRTTAAMAFPVMFPLLSQRWEADRESFFESFAVFLIAMGGLGFVCAMGMTFGGRELAVMVYGKRYAGAGPILVVGTWAVMLTFINWVELYALMAVGAAKSNMVIMGAGLVAECVACAVLIPRWGGLGAAWALLLRELFMGIGYAWASRKILLNSARHWLRPALWAAAGALVLTPVLRWAPLPTALKSVLAPSLTIAILFAFGVFTRHHLSLFRSLLSSS